MARVRGALNVLGANFGANVNGSDLSSYVRDELDKSLDSVVLLKRGLHPLTFGLHEGGNICFGHNGVQPRVQSVNTCDF